MFSFIFFILFLSYASAYENVFEQFFSERYFANAQPVIQVVNSKTVKDYPVVYRSCDNLFHTEISPFVVFILYKTSGNFLGMGGIIDRKTVITAEKVITSSYRTPSDLLVLAGCLSPWWSRNSQVRTVEKIILNECELAVLVMQDTWRFDGIVAPVSLMAKLEPKIEDVYGKDLGTFGLAVDEFYSVGDKVSKSAVYYFSVQTCTSENDCGSEYYDLKPDFNTSIHTCLHPNGSHCAGCVGSPVVGLRGNKVELVGVVVRSSCLSYMRHVVILKLSEFDSFIRANSLLGYKLQEKKKST